MSMSLPSASLIHVCCAPPHTCYGREAPQRPHVTLPQLPVSFQGSPQLCVCLTTFPPYIPPCPYFLITVNGSNSGCMYNETIIYRSTYAQTRILLKRNLVGERELCSYWHLFSISICLSVSLIRLWGLWRLKFFIWVVKAYFGHPSMLTSHIIIPHKNGSSLDGASPTSLSECLKPYFT